MVTTTLANRARVSSEALSDTACIVGGDKPALRAGTRRTNGSDGGLIPWAVVTCVAHITTGPAQRADAMQ